MATEKSTTKRSVYPAQAIADKIFDQLDRLGVSSDQNQYSGLSCDHNDRVDCCELARIVVSIYDDFADGVYDAEKILEFLLKTESASLDPESVENIWELISDFEV